MSTVARHRWSDFALRRRSTEPSEARRSPYVRHLYLLRYARAQWRGLALLVLFMCIGVGFGLIGPWPIKILVDYVFGSHPMPPALQSFFAALPGPDTKTWILGWIAAATVVLFILNTVVNMLESYVSIGVRQRMTYDLGSDLFRHLQRLSVIFHTRRPVGDTIARVTGDPSCVPIIVLDSLLPLLQSFVMLITMFLIMWRLQPTMTLVSLAVVPFLVVSIRIFSNTMTSRTRVRRDLEGSMMSVVEQTLSSIPVVQAFAREDLEHKRFRRYADDTVVAYKRATFSSIWFSLFVGLTTAVGTAILIWLGGRYVLDGKMTTGTLLVFLAYLGQLYGPLNSITYTAQTLSYAFAQADRVEEVLSVPIDVQDRPDAEEADMRGVIRYERVTFGYEPDRPVLKDISLEAGPGDMIAIVGPTGAGKTTLVNLLVRFFDPRSGRITVDGRDLREFRYRSVRQQIALVLQDPFIFPFTVAENIAYARPDASPEEIEEAARASNADEFIARLRDGYATIIGERGATLSGGEKQRLSIARAFLKDAPILILDEPTSALDARTEAHLLDALERLMAGRLTFIIAHRLSTIRNADRILVLDRGEIVEQGRHDDLLARRGLYATLYSRQHDFARHEVSRASAGS